MKKIIYFITSLLFAFVHRHGTDKDGKLKAPYYALILTGQFKRIWDDVKYVWNASQKLTPNWANVIHGILLTCIIFYWLIKIITEIVKLF